MACTLPRDLGQGECHRDPQWNLLSIFIHDLEEVKECTLSRFADDTTLEGTVKILEGRTAIQMDQDKMEE